MKKVALAVVSAFALLTGAEVGLFLWLNAADIAKHRADAFLRQKAYASAVELYQRALSRQPARPDLLLAFARALAGSGRLAEARLTLGQAVALAPGHIEARQFALELAWQANDHLAVMDAAQALLAADPNNQAARHDLARALAATGRREEAEGQYRRLLASQPSEVSARVDLAALLQARGDAAGALENLKRALTASPGNPRVQLGLADLLAGSGRFAEAADLYERYLAQTPDDQSARLRLAETLSAVKAFDRAAAAYRVVLERSPEDADARIKLARALSWSKRYDESIKEYRRVLGE